MIGCRLASGLQASVPASQKTGSGFIPNFVRIKKLHNQIKTGIRPNKITVGSQIYALNYNKNKIYIAYTDVDIFPFGNVKFTSFQWSENFGEFKSNFEAAIGELIIREVNSL